MTELDYLEQIYNILEEMNSSIVAIGEHTVFIFRICLIFFVFLGCVKLLKIFTDPITKDY